MIHHVSSMLETYPKDLGYIDQQKLAECITACFESAQACTACGDTCADHAGMHEHCKVCAETCRRCEQACANLISALG